MRIISWNVNGLRAVIKKGFIESLKDIDADILCLQETKAQQEQVMIALSPLAGKGWRIFCSSAERKGYSGTALLISPRRAIPLSPMKDIPLPLCTPPEGRLLSLQTPSFFLVDVYVPNSGEGLSRLDYRTEWDRAFYDYIKQLEQKKPVIVCGDFNVAHRPVDIANPKANYNKSAGYTQREIDGMDRLQGEGCLIDTFRHFHPDEKQAYSWWSYRFHARERNIGWRIDYFLVSPSLLARLDDAFILNGIEGSDHCPVGIDIR